MRIIKMTAFIKTLGAIILCGALGGLPVALLAVLLG